MKGAKQMSDGSPISSVRGLFGHSTEQRNSFTGEVEWSTPSTAAKSCGAASGEVLRAYPELENRPKGGGCGAVSVNLSKEWR